MRLLAARYENDDESAEVLEMLHDAMIHGISWSYDAFGIDRIEVSIPCKNRLEAYERYSTHLGQRLAVFGSDLARPMSGNIVEVRLEEGNRVRYVARGPGYRMNSRRILRTYPATTSLKNVVENIVYRYMPYANNFNYDHIYTNSVTVGGWAVTKPEGSTPADAMREILSFSDASYRLRDFWLVDEPFNGTALQKFIAWYQPRVTTETASWTVNASDLQGGVQIARSLDGIATSVKIYYGLVTGTITALGTNTVTDSAATFISNNVKSGDIIENKTVGGDATILSVNSETQVTIGGWRPKYSGRFTAYGGTDSGIDSNVNFTTIGAQVGDVLKNDTDSSQGDVTGISTTYSTDDTLDIAASMSGGKANSANERYSLYGSPTVGDEYSIRTAADYNYVEASVTTIDYWEWEYAENQPAMDATQALQYANSLLVDEPQQVEPFTITAPFVRDANGALWPVWEIIAQMGARRSIKIADIFPSVASLAGTVDKLSTFYITSLEYNGDNHSLRVGIDRPDRRLDYRLLRAKILNSAGVGLA